MKVSLPYGHKDISWKIPDDMAVNHIRITEVEGIGDIGDRIKDCLHHPLDAHPLRNRVSRGDTVVIVIDDYTRPCPTNLLLPPVLDELHAAGIESSNITIIIATGTHQPPSIDMMKSLVGPHIFHQYSVIANDVFNKTYITVGTSSFGHPIELLKEYVDATVKIMIGDIEYHYFAGFGGTRKSILPGIASKKTIQNNHSMMFKEGVAKGVIDTNPVNIEMNEAMAMAGCDFALSVVMNSHHEIVDVWGGNPISVMSKGMKRVNQMYKKEITERPDIIIIASDGHPHDINLYQALKSLYTASQVIARKGVIILVAACPDGMGNERYARWMDRYVSSDEMKKALENDFKIGAHKAYYHRQTIENNQVILVSEMNDSYVQDHLGFIPAPSIEHAVDIALGSFEKTPNVLVVPQGSTTHLVLSN